MSIAIAITCLLLLVVLVALLGTMREVVVLQGKVTGLTDLLLKPPSPQFFDGMLPDLAREKLMQARPAEAVDSFFLLFVRQGCSGCARLLQGIKAGIAEDGLDARRFTCVLSGRPGGLDRALRTIGVHVIADGGSHLEEACQVKQTPTALHLDFESLKVLDAVVGADIDWIRSRLKPELTGLETPLSVLPPTVSTGDLHD